MNLDETKDGFCRHGMKWTAPVPCVPCIESRVGVYDDYGGYGSKWSEADGPPIFCAMCLRSLDQADLDAVIEASPRAYVNAGEDPRAMISFDDMVNLKEAKRGRLVVPHCETCRPGCERCNRSKAGLCPEPECVAEPAHKRAHGGDHRDKRGKSWNCTINGRRAGGDYGWDLGAREDSLDDVGPTG